MISRAPGKMILLGEYAVLEGAPALVCAINRRATVRLTPREINEFQVQSPSMGIENEPFVVTPRGHLRFNPSQEEIIRKRLVFFTRIFEYSWQYLNQKDKTLPPLTIALNTDEFYSTELGAKLGLGSSAAMAVALVYGLFKLMDRNFGLSEIYTAAYRAHFQAQGNMGSGIDIAASTFGGRLIFHMPPAQDQEPDIPQRVSAWQDLKILTIWTGKAASTRDFIMGFNRLKEEAPQTYARLIDRLSELSARGCQAYKEQNMTVFLETVRQYYAVMNDLGQESGMAIISEPHQKAAQEAEQLGLAYKPSGAGGGDIGMAFGNDPEQLAAFSVKMQQSGFMPLDIQVFNEGVEILEGEPDV